MKWALAIPVVLVVAACVVVGYVTTWQRIVLERSDVLQMRVVELQQRPTVVRISGTSGHSALSVRKITTRIEGTVLDVEVYLFLARKGTSGGFQYDVVIPDSVKRIRFGDAKETIWQR